jgi:hypothetical protein
MTVYYLKAGGRTTKEALGQWAISNLIPLQ